MCPGRESNPHGRFGPRDFKSLVSTISPPGHGWPFRKGAERTAKIRNNSDNENVGRRYKARLYNKTLPQSRFAVHVSPKPGEMG